MVVNFIDDSAEIDSSVKVWNGSYVGKNSSIGHETKVGSLVHIDYDVKIGHNCYIEGLVYIAPKTKIGHKVFLGPNVTILNDTYPPSKRWAGVTIEDGAVIGGGSVIRPGIIIGQDAVIGMGSVVTKNIPPRQVWFGNPAKYKYSREEYDKLQNQYEEDISKKKELPSLETTKVIAEQLKKEISKYKKEKDTLTSKVKT